MAKAIINQQKWLASGKNLEEYIKLGGRVVEGTNEQVQNTPAFDVILDPEKAKKSKKAKKSVKSKKKK